MEGYSGVEGVSTERLLGRISVIPMSVRGSETHGVAILHLNALVKATGQVETQHLHGHWAALVFSPKHGGAIPAIFLDKIPIQTDVDEHSFGYTSQTAAHLAQGVQQLAPIAIIVNVFQDL